MKPTSMFTSIFIIITTTLSSLITISSSPSPSFSTTMDDPSTMNMDPQELETLFQIMDSMSSDQPWRTNSPNPCRPGSSWPGIDCKQGSNDNLLHVTRLDFGSWPNPTCKKTSTFPTKIFSLPYLQSIFFFNCFSHTKTTITVLIPKTTTASSPLIQLCLKNNPSLVGPIPPQLADLKSLQILTLSQNNLSGHIPQELTASTSLLQHLDLSYNTLSGPIPDSIGELSQLVSLDLSYNLLSGTIPPRLGYMGCLQKLDLSSNNLSGKLPELSGLLNLSFIALSNNKLKGEFPKGLKKLVNLEYFIMDDNPMGVLLPDEVGELVKLQELRLANSGYFGVIPDSYSKLVNLSSLSLENNNLSGRIPSGFGGLNHLYHLNLSKNMLGGVVPFDVGFIKRLGRNMDLSGNNGLCLEGRVDDEEEEFRVGICGRNGSLLMNNGSGSGGGSLLPLGQSDGLVLGCHGWLMSLAVVCFGVWFVY